MQIYDGKIDNPNPEAKGGTELITQRLCDSINNDLLKEFQIVVSRQSAPLDETKLRIFYAHDLAEDPESDKILRNSGWDKFHKLVFVSSWQMQNYISRYNIPWSKCVVIQNGIMPMEKSTKSSDMIRLAYWSTPHRGLDILVPVFEELAKKYDNIELNLFSSFKLYGWEERDQEYQYLFDRCEENSKIVNHGSVSNDVIRDSVRNYHILAYPNTWPETSCMVLMEAMSAGLLCVHSNLAALPETAANWTLMYQFDEDKAAHANKFYQMLDFAIQSYHNESWQTRISSAKTYSDVFYNWSAKIEEWKALLSSLLNEPREFPQEMFILRT